jgi:hypothetical protein
MHLYGVQMACCTVEIQELVASVVVSLVVGMRLPDGIGHDPTTIEKVTNWPHPTTLEEVRQFLRFIGYYRKFAKDFSKITSH